MDSLANYGSDDDYESSDEKSSDWPSHRRDNSGKQEDANYEEVQMDLSEDSNDGQIRKKDTQGRGSNSDDERNVDSPRNTRPRHWCRRDGRSRSRDRIDSRTDDRVRDSKDDIRADKYSRNDRNYRKERDRKYDRERKRSSSRERRRSSSKDRRRSSSRDRYRRSPKRERSRRSRSRSWGRYRSQRRRSYSKNSRNESSEISTDNQNTNDNNRFFMPGITGKYREQIEKRKLLWQKKDSQSQAEIPSTVPAKPILGDASTSRVTKIWEATTFAQDRDGKVASKFKRLMGIKAQADSSQASQPDIIKKQEEMFSSMEQQYEVARTATHTMRGVGLGFTTSYTR